MKKFWCFLLALAGIAAFSADLVKDGQAAGVIVLSSNPTRSARFAAAELNYHIEKMTGVQLPVTDSPQTGKTNIFVGAGNGTPANDSFDRQEYLIKVGGSSIFLLGQGRLPFLRLSEAEHVSGDLGRYRNLLCRLRLSGKVRGEMVSAQRDRAPLYQTEKSFHRRDGTPPETLHGIPPPHLGQLFFQRRSAQ